MTRIPPGRIRKPPVRLAALTALTALAASIATPGSAHAGLGTVGEIVRDYETITRNQGSGDSAGEQAVDLSDDAAVDLGALDAAPPAASPHGHGHGHASTGGHGHGSGLAMPTFKTYFDFALYAMPGVHDLTFNSFHTMLFFEIIPTPDLQFTFDISSSPRFFELDYKLTERLTLRMGKIWIPFDDLIPHNIFGGRVNVSKLSPGAAFLPDIFTDLGAAVKYQIVDSMNFGLEGHLYAVNGFRSGGTDLRDPNATAEDYPSFSDAPIGADNNRNKAIGGRLHALLWRKVGLGFSYYTGRWSSTSQSAYGLNMLGVDTQLRFGGTQFRAGLATMSVDIPADTVNRGGLYVEVGQRFGPRDQFKILGRGGMVQLDDRVIDVTDQTIIGGALLYQPGMIQFSAEYSRDINDVAVKKNRTLSVLRVVVAL